MLRNKFGRNITYDIIAKIVVETWKHEECFAIITLSESIGMIGAFAKMKQRDFDVMEEGFGMNNFKIWSADTWSHFICVSGEFVGAYMLYNKHYIPDRTVDEFDELSAAMVESGLLQFFISTKIYEEKIQQIAEVKRVLQLLIFVHVDGRIAIVTVKQFS